MIQLQSEEVFRNLPDAAGKHKLERENLLDAEFADEQGGSSLELQKFEKAGAKIGSRKFGWSVWLLGLGGMVVIWILVKKLFSTQENAAEEERRHIQHLSSVLPSSIDSREFDVSQMLRQPVYRDFEIKYSKVNRVTDWVHIVHPETNVCSVTFRVGVGNYDEDKSKLKYFIANKQDQDEDLSDRKRIYPDGAAHLNEHAIFLFESPADRQINSYWNAGTRAWSTSYQFDSSFKDFTKSVAQKWNILTQFPRTSAPSEEIEKKIRGEVTAVNNEYEMDLGLIAWKLALAQKEVLPKDHVVSRFVIGSKKTLDFAGIGQTVVDFFNNNYSLEKVKIVSVCNQEYNKELDLLRNHFESNEKTIKNHTPSQMLYRAPKLETNKMLFVKVQGMQAIQVSSYLDDVLGSMEETNDYFQFFQVVFEQLLNQKLGDLGSCSVQNTFENSFFQLKTFIAPSFEGKKNIKKIIQIYNEVLQKTGPSLNIVNFKEVKKNQLLKFAFEKAQEELYKLTESLADNMAQYGLSKMFMADKIITKGFVPDKIHKVYTNLKEGKQIWSVMADFPTEEKASDSPNLLKSSKIEELLSKKLMIETFLGVDQTEPGVKLPLRLGYKHPEHGFYFGIADFQIPPHDINLGAYHFKPSKLTVDPEVLKKIAAKPEGKIEIILDEVQTKVTRNTMRSTPDVVISVQFSLETISKSLDMDLQILKEVLNNRLGSLSDQMKKLGGSISAAHNATTASLELTVSVFAGLANSVFEEFADLVIKNPSIDQDEMKMALNTIYLQADTQKMIFLQGFSVFGTWLSQNRNFTKLETIEYLRTSVSKKLSFDILKWKGEKGWKITKTLVEGHVDSAVFEMIKKQFLTRIDPSYNEKRVISTNSTDFNLELFDKQMYSLSPVKIASPKTRIIDYQRIDKTNQNELFTTIFYAGEAEDTIRLARVQILLNLLHNEVFDQLRTKLKLGYVVGAKMFITHRSIYIALVVQTLHMDKARREVEKFYSHFEGYLSKFDSETFEQKKNAAISSLAQKKNNFADEVYEKWSEWVLGLPLSLKEKISLGIKHSCNLEDIQKLYLEIFKDVRSNKVILDTKYSENIYNNLKKEGLYRGSSEVFEKAYEMAF